MLDFPAVITVELREHGTFSAAMSDVQAREKMPREKLCREIAAHYATDRQLNKLFSRAIYWNVFPKAVLCVVHCEISGAALDAKAIAQTKIPQAAPAQTYQFRFQGFRAADHASACVDAMNREYKPGKATRIRTAIAATFYVHVSLAHKDQADAWAITAREQWGSFRGYGEVKTPKA